VLTVICVTWVVPVLVFFTSIIGWQYFVGKRTVPDGMCYVQYMEDSISHGSVATHVQYMD